MMLYQAEHDIAKEMARAQAMNASTLSAKPISAIEEMTDRVRNASARVDDLRRNLGHTADRLFGERPSIAEGKGSPIQPPMSQLALLQEAIDILSANITSAEDCVSRFSGLA